MRISVQTAFLIVIVPPIYAQCIPSSHSPRIERFASISEIKNQGMVGMGLRLEELQSRVVATLTDYLGDDRIEKNQLAGTLTQTRPTECRIHLASTNKHKRIEIDGQIELTRFRGTIQRYVGKEAVTYNLSLRRQLPAETPNVGSTRGKAKCSSTT